MKIFDEDFITLEEVTSAQAQLKHDTTLFNIVYTNVRNDLKALDGSIKELRKHINGVERLYR